MNPDKQKFDFRQIDWQRLALHLSGAFLLAVGGAGLADKPLAPAIHTWFWGSLLYAGGAIQNYAKGGD